MSLAAGSRSFANDLAEGQRFLMVKMPSQNAADSPRIILVENWFEELERLAPT